MESESSGHGAGPRRHNRAYSDMDFRVPGGRRRTHSDALFFTPSRIIESRKLHLTRHEDMVRHFRGSQVRMNRDSRQAGIHNMIID